MPESSRPREKGPLQTGERREVVIRSSVRVMHLRGEIYGAGDQKARICYDRPGDRDVVRAVDGREEGYARASLVYHITGRWRS